MSKVKIIKQKDKAALQSKAQPPKKLKINREWLAESLGNIAQRREDDRLLMEQWRGK